MERKTYKIKDFQGDDKILAGQIKEIAHIYRSINGTVGGSYDEITEDTMKIIEILKSGGGEKEIHKRVSRWQAASCSEAKKQFYRKSQMEAARKIAELYTTQDGLTSTEPLGLEEKLAEVRGEVFNLVKLYVEEYELFLQRKANLEKTKELIEGYDMDSLITLAGELANFKGNSWYLHWYPKDRLKSVLDMMLKERQKRLNKDFQWTAENHAKLVSINNQIFDATVKCIKKSEEMAVELGKQTDEKDSFFSDFSISTSISIYPVVDCNRSAAEHIEEYLALKSFGRGLYNTWYEKKREELDWYYAYEQSIPFEERYSRILDYKDWWKNPYERVCKEFCERFKDDNLCYAIYYMVTSDIWSYADILSVERIYVDFEVNHQYREDVPKISYAGGG